MNQRLSKTFRVPSLLLAAALQVLPIARVALPVTQNAANIIVILFRWAVGSAAALGGVQAVSGASTVITTPTTARGTNGVLFSLRLITSPDQAHYWTASNLPPGINLVGTSGSTTWKLEGTPTTVGVYAVGLMAKDQVSSGASRTVYSTTTMTIVAGANAPPSITAQPANRTVVAGQTATFTVAAGGSAPLSYRWRFGGATVSGQTNATLTLTGVTSGQAGNYDVVITNAYGSVTSAVAVLTVNVPPSISGQPAGQTVNEGQGAAFSVTASGTAPLKYFWRKGTSVIAGATNTAHSIPVTVLGDAGNYSVIVSNMAGSVTSAVAVLTVNALPQPPTISAQPANVTVIEGGNASFSVTAAGTGPLSYQWRLGGNSLGGKTNSALPLTGVTAGQAGNYDVVVSNSVGSVTSAVATLTVNVPPSISNQPQSLSVTEGQPAGFSVTAGGTAPLKYFWRKGTTLLAAGASSNYSIPAAALGDAGNYSVMVSNMAGSVTSAVAVLTVNALPQAPTISAQPTSVTIVEGGNASFAVTASGTGPLSYQWRLGGNSLGGKTNSDLQLTGVTASQAGNYDVVISNSVGSVTSAVAALTVNVAPGITGQPLDQSVFEGQPATFAVAATGTAPLKYFWRKGATVLVAGAASSYSIPAALLTDAGGYSVIVSNMAGSVTSVVATLSVSPVPQPPFISAQPTNRTVIAGGSAAFAVAAGGTDPLGYQWRLDGVVLAGKTNAALNLAGVTELQAGNYDVVITNSLGSVTSAVAVLTVLVPPSISIPPQNLTVTEGQGATFNVTAGGTAPLKFFWRKGATILVAGSSSSFTLAGTVAGDAGGYSVIVSNVAGSVTSVVATLTVNPLPQPPSITLQPSGRTVTAGATVAFTVVAGGTGPLGYQWRLGGDALAGAIGSALTLSNVQVGQAGGYDVVITNAFGSVTSLVATLVVNPAPIAPTITAQPDSLSVTQGQDAAFIVQATGTGPLAYFWRKGNTVVAANAGASFTIPSVTSSHGGGYSVLVSNVAGVVTSAVATLTVIVPEAPGFSAGSYQGLFLNDADVQHGSSGYFTGTLKTNGLLAARLQMGLTKYPISGRFDASGQLILNVVRRGTNSLTIELQADSAGGGRITGRVTDGNWSSGLLARRAVFNSTTNPATTYAGRYTLVVPGAEDGGTAPFGDGCAALSVSLGGTATLSGSMADGARVLYKSAMSGDGRMPVYVPLYRGKGAAFGWLSLTPGAEDDLSGPLHWVCPASASRKAYPAGFHLLSSVSGSIYQWYAEGTDQDAQVSAGDKNPFGLSSGRVILMGGNLSGPVTNAVVFGENGALAGAAPDRITFSLSKRTGLFSGTVSTWAWPRLLRFHGAVLERRSVGSGYFSGTNEIGNFYIGQ